MRIGIEQNFLERNLKKNEYDEQYGRLLDQLEKENFFLKDEIRRKDKFINIFLENFLNYVPEHLIYITSNI